MNKHLENSYLYKTLTSKNVSLLTSKEVTNIINKSKSIKELHMNVAFEINQKEKISSNDESISNFFLLDNIGFGKLENSQIQSGIKHNEEKNTYHFEINNDYADPDKISYMLYYLAKCKYDNKQINGYPVSLNITTRTQDAYSFALNFSCKSIDIDVELGGDWALNWRFLNNIEKNTIENIKKTQTILYHPFWPCQHKDNIVTINQLRADRVSMYRTLMMLKYCYMNNFEYQETDDNDLNNFQKSFIAYSFYYKVFGTKINGFLQYIVFWDLAHYIEKPYNIKNVDIL